MFVVSDQTNNKELIHLSETQWNEQVALEYEKELQKNPYICGTQFTAADIMVGWTLFIASLLGWLDNHPILQKYLKSLSSRPTYQRIFLQ
jgi:glutathione S-transferase